MIGAGATADRVAAATPAERDRFADLVRVASILVVVAGHWLMAVVTWRDGRVEGGNALPLVPGLWLATWLLQVMPLFFFVGGLANLVSAGRGGGWATFVRARAARLLRPTRAVGCPAWNGSGTATSRSSGCSPTSSGSSTPTAPWPAGRAGPTSPWPPAASPPWSPSPAPAPGRRAWSASPASGSPT